MSRSRSKRMVKLRSEDDNGDEGDDDGENEGGVADGGQ